MDEPHYTVGQVSALTGPSVKAIHFYHRAGLLSPATTTGAGYRLYTAHEVWRLELIRMLRHLDFPVAEIRRLLEGHDPTAKAGGLPITPLARAWRADA